MDASWASTGVLRSKLEESHALWYAAWLQLPRGLNRSLPALRGSGRAATPGSRRAPEHESAALRSLRPCARRGRCGAARGRQVCADPADCQTSPRTARRVRTRRCGYASRRSWTSCAARSSRCRAARGEALTGLLRSADTRALVCAAPASATSSSSRWAACATDAAAPRRTRPSARSGDAGRRAPATQHASVHHLGSRADFESSQGGRVQLPSSTPSRSSIRTTSTTAASSTRTSWRRCSSDVDRIHSGDDAESA